jgi:hypothetical protein
MEFEKGSGYEAYISHFTYQMSKENLKIRQHIIIIFSSRNIGTILLEDAKWLELKLPKHTQKWCSERSIRVGNISYLFS